MSELNSVKLSDFAVIKLSGPDAKSFLQGQVTCDVNDLTDDNWIPGCHCNAKGKMWSSFISFKRDDAIYLVLTKESAAVSLAELNKYGVFAKADISDDTSNWFIYGSEQALTEGYSFELAPSHFITLSNTAIEAGDNSNLWWTQEILSGRAHTYQATSGEYVPQMLNLQALNYISFNKGCYMGQEMVARMRYLGKNKRALYVAKGSGSFELTAGQDVFIELNGNRRSAGKVINALTTDGTIFCQLVLAKDTELSQTIYLSQEGTESLDLVELPYSIEES